MRFSLVEDLESDLKSKSDGVKGIISTVKSELPEFKEKSVMNGVAFELKRESDGVQQLGQFYLDTDSNTYSSYLTVDDGDGEVMSIQQNGKLEAEEVMDALAEYKRFL